MNNQALGRGKNNSLIYKTACEIYTKYDDKLNQLCEEHPDIPRYQLQHDMEQSLCGGHTFQDMAVAQGRTTAIAHGYTPDDCSVLWDGYNPYQHPSPLALKVGRTIDMNLYQSLASSDAYSQDLRKAFAYRGK
ncbi:MAG TPA: hypothetical protein PLT28_00225 [Saprospiraceae bacterium]|nr:hypothetical protein [Saprospiraceae bacterium]